MKDYIRLNIITEGETEEAFVNRLLKPYLETRYTLEVSAKSVGGLLKYQPLKKGIQFWMKADRHNPNCRYTSMVDLYAFPKDDQSPYTLDIQSENDPYQRVARLEASLKADINSNLFIPYVQLHEFETLILVDPNVLRIPFPNYSENVINRLKTDIRFNEKGFNPELINGGQHSAPSKRIIKFIPHYQSIGKGNKHQGAISALEAIGFNKMRTACQHFNQWLNILEGLASPLQNN